MISQVKLALGSAHLFLNCYFPSSSEYYYDFFTDYFANLGTQVPSVEIMQAAVSSGFPVPEVAKVVRVRPSGSPSAGGASAKRRQPIAAGAETETQAATEAPRVGPVRGQTDSARPVRRRRPSLSLSR